MRMWMTPPAIMCDRHLLGEHVETHMFLGSLKKRLAMTGYLANNLFEPLSLRIRHDELADEMTRRGMRHQSPFVAKAAVLDYLGETVFQTVDRDAAFAELVRRCGACAARAGIPTEGARA